MRKLAFVLLFALAFGVTARQAFAIQSTLATKQISVTIIITPSPIVYVPTTVVGRVALPSVSRMDAMVAYDPYQLSDTSSMIAQTTPQGSVKVQFTVKPDPTYQYFHLTPVNTTMYAGYGSNTFTCVYRVFGSYATSWQINDWAYGSNTSGGTSGFNSFPMYNTPTAPDLAWLAETITTSYTNFANGGAPGQLTFSGAAGTSKNICIDLSLTVPSSIASGTYGATISYRMTHS